MVRFEGDALRCGPADAAAVRAGAQLQGTMGGAGHLHRTRLGFPIVAWTAVLAAGAQAVAPTSFDRAGPWLLVVASVALFGGWMFPARPYWYREMTGGGVAVMPPDAVGVLTGRLIAPDGQEEDAAGSGQGS